MDSGCSLWTELDIPSVSFRRSRLTPGLLTETQMEHSIYIHDVSFLFFARYLLQLRNHDRAAFQNRSSRSSVFLFEFGLNGVFQSASEKTEKSSGREESTESREPRVAVRRWSLRDVPAKERRRCAAFFHRLSTKYWSTCVFVSHEITVSFGS